MAFRERELAEPMPSFSLGGFVKDADKAGFYEVKTWWQTMADFEAWVNSPSFAEAHANRPPKEMFAGSNVLEIHEVFLSTDE